MVKNLNNQDLLPTKIYVNVSQNEFHNSNTISNILEIKNNNLKRFKCQIKTEPKSNIFTVNV